MADTDVPPEYRSFDDYEMLRNLDKGNVSDPTQQVLGAQNNHRRPGVTIRPATHLANGEALDKRPQNTSELLSKILPEEEGMRREYDVFGSSFVDQMPEYFQTASNGFVTTAIEAYSGHRHLRIRPEDIWLAILTQFSSYVNAHAEELRGSFVAHDGKKELVLTTDKYDHRNLDWGLFAEAIGLMIQDNVVDPELRHWILPAFSTTTQHDTVVANIVMMASMQAYFEYSFMMTCGLPSVTLLGERADYEVILSRLEKLRSYGEEPKQFVDLLTPVLKHFILSFDEPQSDVVLSFWNRIFTSREQSSGSPIYSGWITAFCFWDKDGKSLYARDYFEDEPEELARLYLNGTAYHQISMSNVPPGYATVPVKIEGGSLEKEIMAEMLAGSIGMERSSSGNETADGGVGIDTLQPKSGWLIYEKGEQTKEQWLIDLEKRWAERDRQFDEEGKSGNS